MDAQVESMRVVVVDDDLNFLVLYQVGLRKSRHIVTFFSSAEAALSHCRDNQVDVIITDRNMLGLSGPGFAEAIRGLGLTIPIGMASCGVVDLLPFQKTEILQHGVDVLVEKSDVLGNADEFIGRLYQLGQARQNLRHYSQEAVTVFK